MEPKKIEPQERLDQFLEKLNKDKIDHMLQEVEKSRNMMYTGK